MKKNKTKLSKFSFKNVLLLYNNTLENKILNSKGKNMLQIINKIKVYHNLVDKNLFCVCDNCK